MNRFLFSLTIATCFSAGTVIAQPAFPGDAATARIVSTDLQHFLEAKVALTPGADSLQVLQTLYFDRGTPGLVEYCQRHGLNAELLKEAMAKHPGAYSDIASFLEELPVMEQELLKDYARLKELLPSAVYPPTYLLVGAHRGIAQASRVGQLVTIEKGSSKPEPILHNIVHELVHFQQAMTQGIEQYQQVYAKPDNMLDLVLREGGAQFVTYVLVNDNLDTYYQYTYLTEHEEAVKNRFKKDLAQQAAEFWMWDSLEQDEYPKLLGYAMGCRIAKAYFDRSTDKERALKDILEIKDANAFLNASGYLDVEK